MSEEKPIVYAHSKLPELLELLGFWESKVGLWQQRHDENTDLFVDFRPASNGNPRGRRYAVVHQEGKPDRWITGDEADQYSELVEYKQRRDTLLEKKGEQPTTEEPLPTLLEEKNPVKTLKTSVMKKSLQSQPERQREAEQRKPELTIETIKRYINPDVTDEEAYVFLQLCKAQGLNPFIGEAYLIKYKGSPAKMVVGKDVFLKRAEKNPAFDGFESGIIVRHKDGTIKHKEGSAVYPDEGLLGGWAKVYRKDRKVPFYNEVSLNEYMQYRSDGKPQKMWEEKKATMIRKVPLVQSLREAFPGDLGGLYDSSEMGVEQE